MLSRRDQLYAVDDSKMPPRKDAEYMDVDSDSDISLPDQDYAAGKKKGKGTGKAGERERGKRKGKAKENVRPVCFLLNRSYILTAFSNRIHGKHHMHGLGIWSKRMRRVVCKHRSKSCWRGGDVDGQSVNCLRSRRPQN